MKNAKKNVFLIGFMDESDSLRKEYATKAKDKEAAVKELLSELDPDFGGQILFVDLVSSSGKHTQVYTA